MHSNNDNYDFLCGNDAKFVAIAIKNDLFHTVAIQADAAKTVDFAGGTRNIEEISLSRCLKMSQIHWPSHSGTIKRLKISFADTLAKLDLTALSSLEELSIINCTHLSNIIGIPASLKQINIHGANITNLDISACENLEVFNLVTRANHFHAEFSNLNRLHSIYLATEQQANTNGGIINCIFNHCHALRLLAIEASAAQTQVNIHSCPNIQTLYLDLSAESEVTGLSNCGKLDFAHITRANKLIIDPPARQMLKTIHSKNAEHTNLLDSKNKLDQIRSLFSEFRASVLHTKPGPDDIETVIQQNSSPREKNSACTVKIHLLGLAISPANQDLKHNEFHRRALLIADELKGYLNSSHKLIYYLDRENASVEIQSQLGNARIPTENEDTIVDWLKNKDERNPNILLLRESSMFIPSVSQFLLTFTPNRRLIIYKNTYYKLSPSHKIIADESLKPFIEHFTSKRELPLTLVEQNQFLHAALTSHHLISQTNQSAAAKLLPTRQFRNIVSQFLNALQKANNNIAPRPESISTSNSSISTSQSPNQGSLSTEATNSRGKLTSSNEELPSITSKPIHTSHKKSSSEKAIKPSTGMAPLAQSGKLSHDNESDLTHSMAAKIHHARQANPQTIHLPNGQYGKLSTEPKPDDTLASAHIKSLHEAMATSHELIEASSDLAEAAKLTINQAKLSATDVKPEFKNFDIIADSFDNLINEISHISTANDEYQDETIIQRRLNAAKELVDAVRRLNLACDQLYAISQTTIKLPNLDAIQHAQVSNIETGNENQDPRQKLINLLTHIQNTFITNYRAKNLSEGLFGTGFKAGVNNMRLNILNSLLQALENNQPLNTADVKQYFRELMKDPYLANALTDHKDLLEAYLTTDHSPRHNQVDHTKD